MGRRPMRVYNEPVRKRKAAAPKETAADAKAKAAPKSNTPPEMQFGHVTVGIVGLSPLLYHKMSQKAWQELMFYPRPKGLRGSGSDILKHDIYPEFRESVYRSMNSTNLTLLQFPASAFRRAMASVALDMPGWRKTEIGRLLWCRGIAHNNQDLTKFEATTYVNVYGVPRIQLSIVRNLGQNRVPDVRSKAILPVWCCELEIHFTRPNLTPAGVGNLLNNAGRIVGIGDGRQEKGILSNGQFRVCDPRTDAEFLRIKREGGRAAQVAAMADPTPIDDMTEHLMLWFPTEVERRRAEGTLSEPDEADEAA